MAHGYSSVFQFLVLLCLVLLSYQTSYDATIHILHSWRFPDFTYANENARRDATQHGKFIPKNVAILDSDYYISPTTSKKRVFVTTPQFNLGIPATLSEVTEQKNSKGELLLAPFPTWKAQTQEECWGPVSVYRIHIDQCGLLWVLDTGRVETFTNPRRVCRPKLIIYDLKQHDDPIIERYEFPDGSINDRSNLITLVTESNQDGCRDSFAYIADVNAYGLVVFDLAHKQSWRVESNFFYPFPDRGTQTVAGVTFDLMDGVFGLALSPPTVKPRKLYFHSLASVSESWVLTNFLRDRNLTQNANSLRTQFHLVKDVREHQSSLEVMTDDGILIYSVLPQTALACWNSAHPLEKAYQHVIYQDAENLQFVSGMKLKGKELLITTSRLQNYIAGNLDSNDVKYRLIVIDDVDRLLKGTPCKINTSGGRPSSLHVDEFQNHKPSSSLSQNQHHHISPSSSTSRFSGHY